MGQDANAITELSFEDALEAARGDRAATRVGRGFPLDRSIELYAEGDKLRAQCEARLAAAQARIEKIALGGDGRPAGTRPFDAE